MYIVTFLEHSNWLNELEQTLSTSARTRSVCNELITSLETTSSDDADSVNLLVGRSSYTFKVETLQEMVGHAVNCLVKYYHKSERERRLDFTTPPAAFTKLLYNLTVALESVFTHGLKTTGIFKYVVKAMIVEFQMLNKN